MASNTVNVLTIAFCLVFFLGTTGGFVYGFIKIPKLIPTLLWLCIIIDGYLLCVFIWTIWLLLCTGYRYLHKSPVERRKRREERKIEEDAAKLEEIRAKYGMPVVEGLGSDDVVVDIAIPDQIHPSPGVSQ